MTSYSARPWAASGNAKNDGPRPYSEDISADNCQIAIAHIIIYRFHDSVFSPAMGGAAGARIIMGESRRGVYVFLLCGDAKLNFDTAAVESFSHFSPKE